MSEALRLWLSKKITERNLSHNELARQSGLAQSTVSSVLAGNKNPGCDFCIKVASALDVAPEYVLQLAGILPGSAPPASPGPITAEIMQLVENLPPEQRKEILRYVRYLSENRPGEK